MTDTITAEEAKAVTDSIKSPIDRALQQRNAPGQRPLDPAMKMQERLRAMPPVPIDFTPGQVAEDDPARVPLGQLSSMWTNIAEAAKDQSLPLEKLEPVATRALQKALTSCDSAVAKIETQIAALDTKINETVAPKAVDSTFAMEIRREVKSIFTAKDGKPRADGPVSELFDAAMADARVGGALLNAPQLLTGLMPQHTDALRRQLVTAKCPESQERLDTLRRSRDLLERAAGRAIEKLGPKLREWNTRESDALKLLKKGIQ